MTIKQTSKRPWIGCRAVWLSRLQVQELMWLLENAKDTRDRRIILRKLREALR